MLPSDCADVALILSVTAPEKPTGAVMVKLARFQACTSTAVLAAVAVKECEPSLSVAPIGMALTSTDERELGSPPNSPVKARLIGLPDTPAGMTVIDSV